MFLLEMCISCYFNQKFDKILLILPDYKLMVALNFTFSCNDTLQVFGYRGAVFPLNKPDRILAAQHFTTEFLLIHG